MPELDEGFDPIPALSEPPGPEETLRLQDALADGSTTAAAADAPVPLGRAPAYDFVNHRLLPGGAGGPLMTRGIETLATWIQKCLRTRRGENQAVDPDFGCDLLAEDLLEEGGPYDSAAVAEYVAAVERALTVHPRISALSNVRIDTDPDDDAVFLTFRVEPAGDDLPDIPFNRLRLGG